VYCHSFVIVPGPLQREPNRVRLVYCRAAQESQPPPAQGTGAGTRAAPALGTAGTAVAGAAAAPPPGAAAAPTAPAAAATPQDSRPGLSTAALAGIGAGAAAALAVAALAVGLAMWRTASRRRATAEVKPGGGVPKRPASALGQAGGRREDATDSAYQAGPWESGGGRSGGGGGGGSAGSAAAAAATSVAASDGDQCKAQLKW